jgi:sister chromatid cohesion protein DCC1
MELPAKLANSLQEGETLVIRGDGTDSAVLCSSNMTFELKEAETSNSFLVVDGLFYPEKNAKG